MRDAQVLIGRGEQVPESPAGPVIVCTRNDDLDGVVEATPPERRGGIPQQSVIALYKLLCKDLRPSSPCTITGLLCLCRSRIHPERHVAIVAG